jgi:MoaA/NifB/PqqE/SkfB family radical SAM enzyme
MSAFASVLARHGFRPLARPAITTLQINVGKVCNQACHHCHVDAGPKRTESMTEATAARILALLEASHGIETVALPAAHPS